MIDIATKMALEFVSTSTVAVMMIIVYRCALVWIEKPKVTIWLVVSTVWLMLTAVGAIALNVYLLTKI